MSEEAYGIREVERFWKREISVKERFYRFKA